MNAPLYPRPHSIRPRIILVQVPRYVVFDWSTGLHFTGWNDWRGEDDARIYSSLHQALEDVRLLKQRHRWSYLLNPDPGPESWN
ncbi:MAG: hypothetical protein ABSG53_11770 [Thermoguttaceae bacterium]|jgi:hypothetical protein